MGFVEAVRTCLRKYADFTGRARRSEYWWFVVFNAVVTTVGDVVDSVAGTGSSRGPGLFGALAILALLVPGLAVAARRAHDVSRSAWILLLLLIPIVGALILVWMFVSDSDPDNRFGPSPKQPLATGPYDGSAGA